MSDRASVWERTCRVHRDDRKWRIGLAVAALAMAAVAATQLPAAAANGGGGKAAQASPPTTPTTLPKAPVPPTTTTTTTLPKAPPPTTTTTTLPKAPPPPTTTTTTVPAGAKGPGSAPAAPTTTTTLPAPASPKVAVAPKATASTTTTTTTTTTVPPASKPKVAPPPGTCQPDPAPAIEALPVGGVFHGSGCYTTAGIVITKPVTIDGGTYNDPVDTYTGRGSVLPIIRVKDTSYVTIENVVLNGANTVGGFHRGLVGQAGLDILASSYVNILNVATNNTFGDGMTLFANFSIDHQPVSNLFVNGLTVTNAGRQGITVGYAKNSTLNNVNVVSTADTGWDFESDLNGVGSANVTINNAQDQKGIHIVEALQGPITFNNCQCERHVHMKHDAATSGQLVSFNGGSLELNRNTATGDNVAGIVIDGPGRIAFNGVKITRMPGSDAPKGPAISVTNGGNLTLVGSPLPAPTGGHDRKSTVTIRS
jgi:hypothetical protein